MSCTPAPAACASNGDSWRPEVDAAPPRPAVRHHARMVKDAGRLGGGDRWPRCARLLWAGRPEARRSRPPAPHLHWRWVGCPGAWPAPAPAGLALERPPAAAPGAGAGPRARAAAAPPPLRPPAAAAPPRCRWMLAHAGRRHQARRWSRSPPLPPCCAGQGVALSGEPHTGRSACLLERPGNEPCAPASLWSTVTAGACGVRCSKKLSARGFACAQVARVRFRLVPTGA
jgi:hypothetical protein